MKQNSRFPSFRTLAAACLIGTFAVAGTARAQPAPADAPAEKPAEKSAEKPDRPQRPGRVFEQLQQTIGQLDLSGDQLKQVREIVRTARQEMQSKAQDAQTMEPRERANMMIETLTDLESKIGAVLTPEQKKTFDASVQTMHDELRSRAGGGAATQPTTRPADANATNGRGGRLMAVVERAMDAAEVTPEQKTKIDPILADAREKMLKVLADARDAGAVDRQAIGQKTREIMDEVRTKMADILTPEQQEKFRAAMQPARGGGRRGGPDASPPPDKPADKPAAMAPAHDSPIAHSMEAGQTGLSSSPATTPAVARLNVGDPLPPFSLVRLDGRTVNNKSLTGKPSVFVFGSYTAASFRDRVPQLQALAKRYGTRVTWLIVYTREMHPSDAADEPERNRDDKIEVATHKTFSDRTAAARLAREHLVITMDLAPDTIDDALTKALDGFPNASLVFDVEGKLIARQTWADPFAIDRALTTALKK